MNLFLKTQGSNLILEKSDQLWLLRKVVKFDLWGKWSNWIFVEMWSNFIFVEKWSKIIKYLNFILVPVCGLLDQFLQLIPPISEFFLKNILITSSFVLVPSGQDVRPAVVGRGPLKGRAYWILSFPVVKNAHGRGVGRHFLAL